MKTQTIDASTFQDTKCGCVGMHEGEPHWLHMDWFEQIQAQRFLDGCYDEYEGIEGYNWDCYCEMQVRRLEMLKQEMERAGVNQVINRRTPCGNCRYFIESKPDQYVDLYERWCCNDVYARMESETPFTTPPPNLVCDQFEWDMPRMRLYQTNVSRRKDLINRVAEVGRFWSAPAYSRKELNRLFVEEWGPESDAMQVCLINHEKALYEIMSGLRSINESQWQWICQHISPQETVSEQKVAGSLQLELF